MINDGNDNDDCGAIFKHFNPPRDTSHNFNNMSNSNNKVSVVTPSKNEKELQKNNNGSDLFNPYLQQRLMMTSDNIKTTDNNSEEQSIHLKNVNSEFTSMTEEETTLAFHNATENVDVSIIPPYKAIILENIVRQNKNNKELSNRQIKDIEGIHEKEDVMSLHNNKDKQNGNIMSNTMRRLLITSKQMNMANTVRK